MDGGQERQGRLLTLYALAGRLEEVGCRSLFQFLLRPWSGCARPGDCPCPLQAGRGAV